MWRVDLLIGFVAAGVVVTGWYERFRVRQWWREKRWSRELLVMNDRWKPNKRTLTK